MLQVPGPFGEYNLVRLLGKGGMASVYLAKRPSPNGLEHECAIKVIHPHLSNDQEFVQMLIDEAQLSSQLKHNNIVNVHHLGNENGLYYITMEFIDGCDVYQALIEYENKRSSFPNEVAAWIAHEACSGLSYAHQCTDQMGTPLNIIHRDISPQNIQLSKSGHVKIVDFGIAKADQRQNQTQQGIIKGKYSYMSPEQAWGDQMDHRSDIFSLGICLYEMIAGEVLYDADNGLGLLEQVRLAQIPNLRAIRPDVPAVLEQIVYRALHPEPHGRYQTAEEMRQALAYYLREAQVSSGAQMMVSFIQSLSGILFSNPDQVQDEKTQAVSAQMFANLGIPSPALAYSGPEPMNTQPLPLIQKTKANSHYEFAQDEKTKALNIGQFDGIQGEEKTRAVSAELFAQLKTPNTQSSDYSNHEQEKTKAVSASMFQGIGGLQPLPPPPPPPMSLSAATTSIDNEQIPSLDQFQEEEKTRALSASNFNDLKFQSIKASTLEATLPVTEDQESPPAITSFPSPQPNPSFPSPQPSSNFPSPQPFDMAQSVSDFPSPYAENSSNQLSNNQKLASDEVSSPVPLVNTESHLQTDQVEPLIEPTPSSNKKREKSANKKSSKPKGKSKKNSKPSSKARSSSSPKLTLLIGVALILIILATILGPKLIKPAAPTRYALSVSANAQGAKVYRDGQDTGQFTPALLQGLKPGLQYLIKVKALGYEAIEKPVMFTSEAIATQNEQSLRLFLKRAKGTLRINSTPSGASVYINNDYLGKTPIFKRNIERSEGGIELKFRRKGCDAKTVILTWGDDLKSFVDTSLSCRK